MANTNRRINHVLSAGGTGGEKNVMAKRNNAGESWKSPILVSVGEEVYQETCCPSACASRICCSAPDRVRQLRIPSIVADTVITMPRPYSVYWRTISIMMSSFPFSSHCDQFRPNSHAVLLFSCSTSFRSDYLHKLLYSLTVGWHRDSLITTHPTASSLFNHILFLPLRQLNIED